MKMQNIQAQCDKSPREGALPHLAQTVRSHYQNRIKGFQDFIVEFLLRYLLQLLYTVCCIFRANQSIFLLGTKGTLKRLSRYV